MTRFGGSIASLPGPQARRKVRTVRPASERRQTGGREKNRTSLLSPRRTLRSPAAVPRPAPSCQQRCEGGRERGRGLCGRSGGSTLCQEFISRRVNKAPGPTRAVDAVFNNQPNEGFPAGLAKGLAWWRRALGPPRGSACSSYWHTRARPHPPPPRAHPCPAL